MRTSSLSWAHFLPRKITPKLHPLSLLPHLHMGVLLPPLRPLLTRLGHRNRVLGLRILRSTTLIALHPLIGFISKVGP
jgi:hypothetical protein